MNDASNEDNIHAAASRGDLATVRRFVEVLGIDVDYRDNNERTPLCAAVDGPDMNCFLMQSVMRYLILKNANMEAEMSNPINSR